MALSKKKSRPVSSKRKQSSSRKTPKRKSPKKQKQSSKKSKKKKSNNGKGVDGFTNEERLKLDNKVIKRYDKLFNSNKYAKNEKKLKPGYVLYPLDDARTMTKIKDLIQRSMNKDGSLKNSLKKHVVSCLNKTLYLCKK